MLVNPLVQYEQPPRRWHKLRWQIWSASAPQQEQLGLSENQTLHFALIYHVNWRNIRIALRIPSAGILSVTVLLMPIWELMGAVSEQQKVFA